MNYQALERTNNQAQTINYTSFKKLNSQAREINYTGNSQYPNLVSSYELHLCTLYTYST
jgi:hypothetical protein